MNALRTFVAVLIAENLKESIAVVQAQVKKLAPDVRWVAPANLHVTLKFLGEVPQDKVVHISAAVEEAANTTPPFKLSFSSLGAFPSPENARVMWVGIRDGRDELAAVAQRIDHILADRGFERESRPFAAHVTIGRLRRPCSVTKALSAVPAENLGLQLVDSVAVMKSDLTPRGPVYEPLCRIELAGGG